MAKTHILERDLTKIIFYLVATVLLASVLAAPLFWFGKWFATSLEGSPLLESAFIADLHESIEDSPFRRYFNRAVLVAALVCAWPTFRWLKAGGAVGMGLQRDPHRWRHLVLGFVISSALLIGMGYCMFQLEYYLPRAEPKSGFLLSTIASAATVGFLEEFFFRGILLGLVLRTTRSVPAVIFVAAFFALVHFLSPPDHALLEDSEVTWKSGFWMLGKVFSNFADPVFLLASFTTLFMAGLVTGYARIKTGALWLPFAIHSGWVFGMKIFGSFVDKRGKLQRGDYLPWAGEDMTVGVFPLVAITINGLLIWLLIRKTGRAGQSGT